LIFSVVAIPEEPVRYLDWAREIFSLPAAPLHELRVVHTVTSLLKDLANVSVTEDRWGNIVVRYAYRPQGLQPICFVGHMDHPGVVVSQGEVFLKGGVQESFLQGAGVLFHDSNGARCGKKSKVVGTGFHSGTQRLLMSHLPQDASFGVWDLPAFQLKKGAVIGRACDDLIAVVSMISLVRHLSERKIPANLECWFTRAEEVGFWGTFGRIQETKPRPDQVLLSIEASNAKGFAVWGGGMIVRVGDRSSVFDSQVTRWLSHHAEGLKKESPLFCWQRLLMGGGSCEATPIQEAGFRTGAICLPLKNYHNHGSRGRLAPEMVSQRDWDSLLMLMLRITTSKTGVESVQREFSKMLMKRKRDALKDLKPKK
jgi:endoglucanase